MCGIVAIHDPGGGLAPGSATRATDVLAHRGPDGRGTWQDPAGRVALGHTRLSMVDPSADQPLVNEDERLRLVVNGEFYDFERIQGDLRDRGHALRTRSDSEIALHLYEERGLDCLDDLRGEFAFALWDDARATLVAARDRFGIKPLFYAEHEGRLVLASEIKALFAAGVPARWDEEAVFDALHLCFEPTKTLFAGVRQVPPAHRLVASAAGVRIERYWDIPYPRGREAARPVAEREAIERTRALLEDAVRLRLRADVPVGCLLSGGLDSSTVLALASRFAERPVTAFTIGFDGATWDESGAAGETASALGASFHLVRVHDRGLADAFPDAVAAAEGLQLNAHGVARYLLSREIRAAGYKTVMAGEGADELFLGYAFLRSALGGGRSRIPLPLRAAARFLVPPSPAVAELGAISPWLGRVARGLGFGGTAVETLVERVSGVRAVLSPAWVARFDDHDPFRALYDSLDARASLREWEPAKALLYLWLRTLFPNYHMGADRLDMAHAVEVRMPFLDHVLFEEVCRVPVAMLARDGVPKHLLREAARPWLPAPVLERPKQPFLAPPGMATPGSALHALARDCLATTTLPFVDRAAVVRLLDGLPERQPRERPAIEALLAALVSLAVLDERYVRASP